MGSELSCLDRRVLEFSQRPCCHCRHGSGQTCGEFHTSFRGLTNTLLKRCDEEPCVLSGALGRVQTCQLASNYLSDENFINHTEFWSVTAVLIVMILDSCAVCFPGPVHLIPSLCCDDTWSQSRGRESRPFHSQSSLNEGWVLQPDTFTFTLS